MTLELRWMGTHTVYTILRFELANGRDFAHDVLTPTENALLGAVANFTSNHLLIAAAPGPRFARIGVERIVDHEFALTLYDAKDSLEIDVSRRWERFVESMTAFKDILGEGIFVPIYDRKAGKANLVYQTARARIPLWLLGSGVQQLASLLGTILAKDATIVGIEEPELNLRYTLQLGLREVLARMVGTPGGLDQLFITSHSDAFEAAPHFYAMEATPSGPRVERRRVEEVRAAIGMTADSTLHDPNAVLCYLSTEGVVRVPERIRGVLGLPNGGGVVFLQRGETVEVMSDGTFADRFEPKPARDGDA